MVDKEKVGPGYCFTFLLPGKWLEKSLGLHDWLKDTVQARLCRSASLELNKPLLCSALDEESNHVRETRGKTSWVCCLLLIFSAVEQ